VFTPIQTERLLIRAMSADDAASLAARRNDPEVARYQNWTTPFPLEQAESIAAEVAAMDGPENDEWWMATVCDRETHEILGDLALHMTQDCHTAEVGYTFASEHWGKGYAVEALQALVDYLFETLDVTRVFGMLHPDNPASAMVMERCGFLFEGHTRSSFWLDGEVSDDWIYGLLREDWEKWRDRLRNVPKQVEFVPIDHLNQLDVWRLKTHKTQEEFVAKMDWSFIDYLFPWDEDREVMLVPWMRGVKADGDYVGFVMIAEISETNPEPYLWRLLIDRYHQRRGIASRVLEMLVEECKAMDATTLLTSWGEGKGSPRPFYLKHGFVPTGEIIDDETEARLTFT
jgi:RimJ/RimL family protein N-acetyltransferase